MERADFQKESYVNKVKKLSCETRHSSVYSILRTFTNTKWIADLNMYRDPEKKKKWLSFFLESRLIIAPDETTKHYKKMSIALCHKVINQYKESVMKFNEARTLSMATPSKEGSALSNPVNMASSPEKHTIEG